MTSRSGLSVALVGLVMVGLCSAIFGLLALAEDSIPPAVNDNPIAYLIAIPLGIFLGIFELLGLVAIVVGLVMAGKATFVKGSGK